MPAGGLSYDPNQEFRVPVTAPPGQLSLFDAPPPPKPKNEQQLNTPGFIQQPGVRLPSPTPGTPVAPQGPATNVSPAPRPTPAQTAPPPPGFGQMTPPAQTAPTPPVFGQIPQQDISNLRARFQQMVATGQMTPQQAEQVMFAQAQMRGNANLTPNVPNPAQRLGANGQLVGQSYPNVATFGQGPNRFQQDFRQSQLVAERRMAAQAQMRQREQLLRQMMQQRQRQQILQQRGRGGGVGRGIGRISRRPQFGPSGGIGNRPTSGLRRQLPTGRVGNPLGDSLRGRQFGGATQPLQAAIRAQGRGRRPVSGRSRVMRPGSQLRRSDRR
jgi:hypothetical protein